MGSIWNVSVTAAVRPARATKLAELSVRRCLPAAAHEDSQTRPFEAERSSRSLLVDKMSPGLFHNRGQYERTENLSGRQSVPTPAMVIRSKGLSSRRRYICREASFQSGLRALASALQSSYLYGLRVDWGGAFDQFEDRLATRVSLWWQGYAGVRVGHHERFCAALNASSR